MSGEVSEATGIPEIDTSIDLHEWTQSEVRRWMTWRFGLGVNNQLKSPTQKQRFRFAVRGGLPLAQAVLSLATDGPTELHPVVPSGRERISSRMVPFVDESDDRLVVAVGCHEPEDKTQLALAYSLAMVGERELLLVVPSGTEWPTLSRLA